MGYQTSKSKKKWLYLAGVAVLIIVAVLVVLELTNKTHLFHHAPAPATGPVTKGEASTGASKAASGSSNSPNTASGSSPSSSQKTESATASTATLIAPSGVFVSNHRPNLGGQPAPNTMTSSCTTTPGASCQITFTSGGTTKSLPTKPTDDQGSAYWNWTLQSVGLTQGTWSIKATATNGTGSKTSVDSQELVVAS